MANIKRFESTEAYKSQESSVKNGKCQMSKIERFEDIETQSGQESTVKTR